MLIDEILNKLFSKHSLEIEEYEYLIEKRSDALFKKLAEKAIELRKKIYSNKVYIRGLIEISNICKNDCFYCGIRKGNKNAQRYRLSEQQIFECAEIGYSEGFRTFVLQGGEDAALTDDFLSSVIIKIKSKFPDCAITLSVGERTCESYNALKKAGADRYLLRHETADCTHYAMLHPQSMSYQNRMKCLEYLRKSGYSVGCGFMVGSPYQTTANIAKDLKFTEEFSPDMCGIGPFIPHNDTPFKDFESGSVSLTLFLLSVIRIIKPNILLPATTALATAENDGTEAGILAGANVIMPNLSPIDARKKYSLYNGKLFEGAQSAENLEELKEKMKKIGYEIVCDRGDIIK